MDIEDLMSGKIKLEFGNEEQIRTIATYVEAQKEAKEGMKIYRVEIGISGDAVIEVEAQDRDEAEEKARDEFDLSNADVEYDIEHICVKGAEGCL